MARQESDREDLFAEATGLSPKAEWFPELSSGAALESDTAAIVVGLRPLRDGSSPRAGLSLYDGPGRVDHFTADGKWRRAFRDGELVKADSGRMIGLLRERGPGSVALIATEWTLERQRAEAEDLARRIAALIEAIGSDKGKFGRVAPLPQKDTIDHLIEALKSIDRPITIADQPGLAQ